MADEGMIMRHVSSFTALLLGLATAIATLTSGAMAQGVQSQTAAQIEVATLEAASTSLRTQYARMVRMSGKVLTFAVESDANAGAAGSERFVLYAQLNRLWLLDATDTVIEHAYIEVKQTPFDHLVLHWMQWGDVDIFDVLPAAAQIPVFTVESTTPHPLAVAYDALLARPLARATGPLPAGAYFSAGGHVFDTAGAPIANWDSYGPEIALRLIPAETSAPLSTSRAWNALPVRRGFRESPAEAVDEPAAYPQWQWLAVADLAAALTPKQPFEQGDQ